MFELNLIAAGVWEWLIPAVFIVIYLLNHLLTAGKGGAQRDAQQKRRPPAGERPLRPEQPPRQGGQSQLNSEIDQFLKRANERRMEKARREAPPTAAPPRPPLQPLAEQPMDVEPLERHNFDSVSASVQQHLGSSTFEQRAEHLADDIVHSEGEMERHLQQAFGHRVGTLGNSTVSPITDIEPGAVEDRKANAKALAGLLANQQNIKQAIVLKEILERPIDRW